MTARGYGDRVRHALRAKFLRVVDEVVARYHREQMDELHRVVAEVKTELSEHIRNETERVLSASRDLEQRARHDLLYTADREAVSSSWEFRQSALSHAKAFYESPDKDFLNKTQVLEYGLSLAPTGGLALEFGVWSGTTLKVIAAARNGHNVYGFDSFQGLPDDWRTFHRAGEFDRENPPEVVGAELVIGWFEDTVAEFLSQHSEVVDFVHIDPDLYSSAKTALDNVGPRLRPGSVIVFDEYFNYPGWQDHEHKAWLEYTERTGTKFDYMAYAVNWEQVVVQITAT